MDDDKEARIELFLASDDDGRPMLEGGLPRSAAERAPRPKKVRVKELRRIEDDWNDLALQKWAIVAPEGRGGERLLEAIEPLRRLREEEQGEAVQVYRVPPDMDAKQAGDWKADTFWPDGAPEEEVPLYALVLGDLHDVSSELQHVLATNTLVGRVHFAGAAGDADPDGYAAYAEKVVRFAREAAPEARPDFLFFAAKDGSSATSIGQSRLVLPSLAAARERLSSGKLPAASVRAIEAETVDELLAEGACARPSVLLSVSHGLGAPRGGYSSVEAQWRRQGAMVIGHDEILDAERLRGQAFLPGGMWFYLACFGAGTPQTSAYHAWLVQLAEEGAYRQGVAGVLKSLPAAGERPFVAALPQAALRNPQGPLAVLGHLDLAWTYGFSGAGKLTESRKSRILSPLEKLVAGSRAGVALGKLMSDYGEINDDLMREYQLEKEALTSKRPSPVKPADQAHRWMLRNDLRGYVLLGDPAARLPLRQTSSRAVAGREPARTPAARSSEPHAGTSAFTADLLLLHVRPVHGKSPLDVEQCMIAHARDFALASRPNLSPSLLSHRVLSREDGGLTWLFGIEGRDSGDLGDLGREVIDEARERLAGVAEIGAVQAFVDRLGPAPGRGFSRAPEDIAAFGDDLPGWESYVADSGEAEAGTRLPDDLLAMIRQLRARIPPEPALRPHGKGHMYGGTADKAHLAYLQAYLEARAAAATPADRRKIAAFQAFQSREGSTAAINTYDNQIVTWGTGWGGLGWLGVVMGRAVAHEALRDALGSAGVRYRGKGVYDVVDAAAGVVVTGKEPALEVLRSSTELLYLLIHIARGPETRDAATEAQLVTFMGGSADHRGADAIFTQALFNFVTHLKHWAPGFVTGGLEWALPRVDGPPSPERDVRLAVLVTRYFYGKARSARGSRWIPDWRQLLQYVHHMKQDGLDCEGEPFFSAASAPADDPFSGAPAAPPPPPPAPIASPMHTPPAAASPPPPRAPLTSATLAVRPELSAIATGKAVLRRGARGAPVRALQQALIALGVDVPGGADGDFGPGLERVIKAFQVAHALPADGIVGEGTLAALDELGRAHDPGAAE